MRVVECIGLDPDENLLITGAALDSLGSLEAGSSHGQRLYGSVKLAYLDPPFNTGRNFKQYRDKVDPFTWNIRLKDILSRIRRFLAEDGSIWLHLDDAEQHRARLVLDEVFGPGNFVATVIWERTRMPRLGNKPFATRHDYIHVYRKSTPFRLARPAGIPIEAIWRCGESGSTEEATAEGNRLFGQLFATPKPEQLMRRVIELATAPGDWVMDCFAGSGTTAAVAHKLGRRWVAVEAEPATVEEFIKPRMQRVVDGTDRGGISETVGWAGGGGFTHLILDKSVGPAG